MTTPVIELEELTEAELLAYQKINESFRTLDALIQLTVKDKDLTAPPANPVQGDRYIVAEGATGAWLGMERRVAYYTLAGWRFRTPRNGWRAIVEDEGNAEYSYEQIAWEPHSGGGGGGSADFQGGNVEDTLFDLAFGAASAFELTLQGDVVLTVSGATAGRDDRAILIVRQDQDGGHALTFPAGTVWPGGSEPAVSREPYTVHVYELMTHDGGIAIYGQLLAGSVYNSAGPPAPYPSTDDPYWPYVKYLLHMDGNDGESVFTDERGHTVDVIDGGAVDPPVTVTAEKRFGTAGGLFTSPPYGSYDPSKVNYLSLAQHADNDLSSVDWTLELWMKDTGDIASANADSNQGNVFVKGEAFDDPHMFAYIYLGLLVLNFKPLSGSIAGAANMATFNAPTIARINTAEFKHVAICCKGGVFYLAINGYVWSDGVVRDTSGFSLGALTICGGHLEGLGWYHGEDFFSRHYSDEFRLTLGKARYAPTLPLVPNPNAYYAQFTPPALPFSGPSITYVPDVAKRLRPLGAGWSRGGAVAIEAPVDDVSVRVQNRCRIRGVTVVTQGGPGACEIDVRRDTSYPASGGNSIVGATPPVIAAADYYRDAALVDWETEFQIGDFVTFHLEDADTFTQISIVLDVEELQ